MNDFLFRSSNTDNAHMDQFGTSVTYSSNMKPKHPRTTE
jgi:hypothetical protein